MMHYSWLAVGCVAVTAACFFVFQLSSEARLRRRRRKSHSRLVSKARRPIVRFSVRPPEEK